MRGGHALNRSVSFLCLLRQVSFVLSPDKRGVPVLNQDETLFLTAIFMARRLHERNEYA
jgi:hypothetical protein